jgi:hypothetical protein
LGVSGGDVEHPVGTKLEAAAVVPPRHPSDDEFFAGQIDRRRIGGRDGEPGNARPFSELRLEGVDDEALPVFGKAGMEGEAEDMIEPLDRRQITNQIGGGDILVAVPFRGRTQRERKHLPLLLGDHHPIAAGDPHQFRRLVEPERGENRLVSIRRRRNRGAGDPRAGPFGARPGFLGSDRSYQDRDESQPAGQRKERQDGAHGILCGWRAGNGRLVSRATTSPPPEQSWAGGGIVASPLLWERLQTGQFTARSPGAIPSPHTGRRGREARRGSRFR